MSTDTKKGWCSNCRPGRHSLCVSARCECPEEKHRNRPAARKPVGYTVTPEQKRELDDLAQRMADAFPPEPLAPIVPLHPEPEPIGHWRAYNECFRHREDARWSFRTQYATAEGRQPEAAEVDQGVVRCPLDETCRFAVVPIKGER